MQSERGHYAGRSPSWYSARGREQIRVVRMTSSLPRPATYSPRGLAAGLLHSFLPEGLWDESEGRDREKTRTYEVHARRQASRRGRPSLARLICGEIDKVRQSPGIIVLGALLAVRRQFSPSVTVRFWISWTGGHRGAAVGAGSSSRLTVQENLKSDTDHAVALELFATITGLRHEGSGYCSKLPAAAASGALALRSQRYATPAEDHLWHR